MVKELEKFTGLLNFISRAIVPGRTFTRRLYAKFIGAKKMGLKHFHHLKLDAEAKADCMMWRRFLENSKSHGISRPFVDLEDDQEDTIILRLYSDATANEVLGFGVIFEAEWFFQKWEPEFIKTWNPSIEFLELYALCMAVFIWSEKLRNKQSILFCDNQSVCRMISNSSSGCKYCMTLIRKLVLRSLQFNFRVFAHHVSSADNFLADALSRLQIENFRVLAKRNHWEVQPNPVNLDKLLWPLSEYWKSNCANL